MVQGCILAGPEAHDKVHIETKSSVLVVMHALRVLGQNLYFFCRGFHFFHGCTATSGLPNCTRPCSKHRVPTTLCLIVASNIGMSVQSSLLGTSLHTASLSRSAKRCARQRTCCFKASDTGIQSQQTGANDQLPVESTRYEP